MTSRPDRPSPFILLIVLLLCGWSGAANAVGFSLVPIGGTATDGTGVVGDTLVVGLDLVLDEGEYVTIVAPTLQWDQEGGNVLDVTAASEGQVIINGAQLNPLASDIWDVNTDPTDNTGAGIVYRGPSPINDTVSGPTSFYGFEQTTTVFDEDGILQDILTNGIAGAGVHRIGTIEFLLREVGTTEIGFFFDPTDTSAWRSFVTGSGAVFLPNDEIQLNPLSVSAGSAMSLSITVVPEPGTALLLGLGLSVLARTVTSSARPRRN